MSFTHQIFWAEGFLDLVLEFWARMLKEGKSGQGKKKHSKLSLGLRLRKHRAGHWSVCKSEFF
jgi:hypothetical protein